MNDPLHQGAFTNQVSAQVEALQAAAKESQDAALQKQVQRAAGERDYYSHQLATLHGERDRALVEMTRLEEVAPLARNEHGVNKRIVSTDFPYCVLPKLRAACKLWWRFFEQAHSEY